MVEINVSYQNDLRCQAVHGPSKATIHTDAPVDNRGKGESFSPTDLVATGLGSCMLTIMGMVARDHHIDLTGTTVRVGKEMVADPFRRIGRLIVDIHVPIDPGTDNRRRLENGAHGCPAARSLHPDIKLDVTFRWG